MRSNGKGNFSNFREMDPSSDAGQACCTICSSYIRPSADHISHNVWQGFTVDAVKTKVFISIYYQLCVGQLRSINKLNQSALTSYGEVSFDFSC